MATKKAKLFKPIRANDQLCVWWLSISDFFVCGGEHFYGRISNGKTEYSVEYKLNEVDAMRLSTDDFTWEKGMLSSRFFSRGVLIKSAISLFKRNKLKGVLFEGYKGTLEPCHILVAPTELKEEGNELHRQAEEIGFWDRGNENVMEVIYQKWKAFIQKYNIVR